MRYKRPIRKRSFLLFEILLSLALLSLCLFPLLLPKAKIKKEEQKILESLFFEKPAYEAFCRLKEICFEQSVSWKDLIKGGQFNLSDSVTFLDKEYHPLIEVIPLEIKNKKSEKTELGNFEVQVFFASERKKVGPFLFYLNAEKKYL